MASAKANFKSTTDVRVLWSCIMSQLTFSPSVDVLTKIAAFVLNRESNDFRSEIHEYLVMMALSTKKESAGLRKKEIISLIESDLQLDNFPSMLVIDALVRLEKKGYVKRVNEKEDALYFLIQDEKTKINLMNEFYNNTITQVKVALRQRINEKGIILDMNEESQVFFRFRNFISSALSNLGKECCFSLISSHGKNAIAFEPTVIMDDLKNALKDVVDLQTRKIEETAFISYLNDPDEGLSDLLYSLAQSYFFINILHLDPECQLVTNESLKNKVVYLDTNVILHAIIGNEPRDKAVDQALKLTKDLCIRTLISKRTKEEFLDLLSKRKRLFGNNPDIALNRYQKIEDSLEDGLLKDFQKKRTKDPSLTFTMYADRLEEISTIMKNRYGTDTEEIDHGDIYENSQIPQLIETTILEGHKFGLYKSEWVAEHDAFHILLVREERKNVSGDILGPNSWFLTHDRSLLSVERKIDKTLTIPSSIFVDNWVQVISPLVAPKNTKDARTRM